MVRERRPFATYSILVILAATPVFASMSNASFACSAQVVARTWIEPVDEPTTFALTRADLLRGYKVLDVHYRVHAIGTSRYLLNIAPRIGLRIGSTSMDSARLSSSARRISRSCSRPPRTSTSCDCACDSNCCPGSRRAATRCLSGCRFPRPERLARSRVRGTAPNLAEVRHRVTVLRALEGEATAVPRPAC